MEELSQVATRFYELARFIRERDTGPVIVGLAEGAVWRDPLASCQRRFRRLERMAWRLLPPEARDGCSSPKAFVERQTGERFRERVGIDLAAEAFADAIALWLAGRAPADGAASDAPQHGDGNGQDAAASVPSPKKGTVNARMLELIQRDLARVGGWTAKQWAAELQCAPSSIVEAPTWKELAIARERQRAEKAADRRRRKRPGKRD